MTVETVDNDCINKLLEQVAPIRIKQEKKSLKKEEFNIFKLLRKPHDEVRLHSRFLYTLLNPKGNHNKGNIFLNIFLETIGITQFDTKNSQVYYEKYNIDILIVAGERAILIENKIYAHDGNGQLCKYYHKLKSVGKKEIHIVYLSLDRQGPKNYSLREVEKNRTIENEPIRVITYKNHINTFIKLCKQETLDDQILHQTLKQYDYLINQLLMTADVKARMAFMSLLNSKDKIKNAHFIAKNWVHIKWHTEFEFWKDLYTKIADSKTETIKAFEFTDDKISKNVHFKKGHNYEYGISMPLFSHNDQKICFMIKRGQHKLHFGARIIEKVENFKNNQEDLLKFLIKQDTKQSHHHIDKNYAWLVWKFPEETIDFTSFENDTTLSLVDNAQRKIIVQSIWEQAQTYRDNILSWYNEYTT